MSEKDQGNLLAIIEAAQKIQLYITDLADAEAFFADTKSFDAVLMNFVVIGESVTKLSPALQLQHPHVPWGQIKGFRNLIAHNYFGVDAEEVWQIIHDHLPSLQHEILALLSQKE